MPDGRLTSDVHPVVFRADADAGRGGGHVMRCLALAQTLAPTGRPIIFACRAPTLKSVPALSRSGFDVLDLVCDPEHEARSIARHVGRAAMIVVDHYDRGVDFERNSRAYAQRVIAFDDLGDAEHDADIVVSPLIERDADDFSSVLASSSQLLQGPRFAPLRDEFRRARGRSRSRHRNGLERVFVGFGATDPVNATALALDGLEAFGFAGEVDVTLGAGAPHLEQVRSKVAAMGGAVRLHVDSDDVADLLAAADLAVGAGGSSSWERCCLGVPALTIEIAANQHRYVSALAARGATVHLGSIDDVTADQIAGALKTLETAPLPLAAMSQAASSLCDGLGGVRILAASAAAVEGKARGRIALTAAASEDEARLLAWQSDPRTRRHARCARVPAADEHGRWLASVLADPDRLFFVVTEDGEAAGSLRLDRVGDGFEVSIYTAPDRYRRGIAQAALKLAQRVVPGRPLYADVLPGNDASRALFRAAGFNEVGTGRYVLGVGTR